MLRPPTDYPWPHPWEPFTAELEAAALEYPRITGEVFGGHEAAPTLSEELQRECCPAHPLHGIECIPVAWAKDNPNEFVFVTNVRELPIVFVHLTWEVETDAMFPRFAGYGTWKEFQVAWTH